MNEIIEKCDQLRQALINWHKENVAPLKEENEQLKARIKTLEAESQRYRSMAQKLKAENKRLHDMCEYIEDKPKYEFWRKEGK